MPLSATAIALIIALVLQEANAAPGQIADIKSLIATIQAHPQAAQILTALSATAKDFLTEAEAVLADLPKL